jgi:rhomboid family GlyGly-CTERM serine protease
MTSRPRPAQHARDSGTDIGVRAQYGNPDAQKLMKIALPTHAVRSIVLPLAVALLALGVWLAGDVVASALRYQRAEVLDGELWRLLSAHFVHLGAAHLALNLAGLALVWWLVGRSAGPRSWSIVLAATALSTTLGLLAFAPELAWYVGLSGMLHGMLVAGALLGPRRDLLIVGVVAIKIGWEQWMGPSADTTALIGGAVIVDAHLYGAIGGAIAGLALRWQRLLARR